MPFRIGPLISAAVIAIAVSAAIVALAHIAGELYRGGRAEAEAEHAQAQADAQKQASTQAAEAARAREEAFKDPASAFGWLRQHACTNCPEAR